MRWIFIAWEAKKEISYSGLCTPFTPVTRLGLWEKCEMVSNETEVCETWSDSDVSYDWAINFIFAFYVMVSFFMTHYCILFNFQHSEYSNFMFPGIRINENFKNYFSFRPQSSWWWLLWSNLFGTPFVDLLLVCELNIKIIFENTSIWLTIKNDIEMYPHIFFEKNIFPSLFSIYYYLTYPKRILAIFARCIELTNLFKVELRLERES